jgi:Reverse transcriptase (RNA-dependent DNA polymerase)
MKVVVPPHRKKAKCPQVSNTIRVLPCPKFSPFTILDSGTDIAILGKGWTVVKYYNAYYTVNGKSLRVVDAITRVVDGYQPTQSLGLVKVCRALHNPDELESLIPPAQMEWFGLDVDVKPLVHGGTQRVSSHRDWLDLYFDGKLVWFLHQSPSKPDLSKPLFQLTDSKGYNPEQFALEILARGQTQPDSPPPTDAESTDMYSYDYSNHDDLVPTCVSRRRHVWDAADHIWKPHQLLEWQRRLCTGSADMVKQTFLATTQLVPSVLHENQDFPKDHHVARFPILAHRRLKEVVYADPVEFTVGNSKEYAMLVACKTSKVRAIYPLGRTKSAENTLAALQDFVREYGVPQTLYSDYGADCNKSKAWIHFARHCQMPQRTSEAHHHESNYVERSWQNVKQTCSRVMGLYMIPEKHTFSVLTHICDCFNHSAIGKDKRTPLEILTGDTPDISVFRFKPYEPVFYLKAKATLDQREWVKGRFLGIAWSTGDQMCYRVVPDGPVKQQRVVHRSIVLPRHPNDNIPRDNLVNSSDYYFPTPVPRKMAPANARAGDKRTRPVDVNEAKRVAEHQAPAAGPRTSESPAQPPQICEDAALDEADGKVAAGTIEAELRAAYLQMAVEEQDLLRDISSPPEDDYKDIDRILRYKSRVINSDTVVTFAVLTHYGSTMDCTFDDLKVDAPRKLAAFILSKKKMREQHVELYKWAEMIKAKADKAVILLHKQQEQYGIPFRSSGQEEGRKRHTPAKVRRMQTTSPNPKKKPSKNQRPLEPSNAFAFGIRVPRTVNEAIRLDKENGNTLWQDAIRLELATIWGMATFSLVAHQDIQKVMRSHQFAPLRMIFNVKQDLRRKARLVIGGHIVDSRGHELYASNMHGVSARLLLLISAANNLTVMCGDIKAAYLYAKNMLKTYVKLGIEFNVFDETLVPGSLATVEQALYGLPTSAHAWHQHLAESLRSLGFKPSRYDQDVWLKERVSETCPGYDYIGTHTDDLMIVAKHPAMYMEQLQKIYTINNIGPPVHHLGCDYCKNSDGNWTISTKSYVQEALSKALVILNVAEHRYFKSPMDSDVKPEMDESDLLGIRDHRKYQQLIGILQWMITCGRMDIMQAVNSLSRFSAAPRAAHLKMLARVFGYLRRFPNHALEINTTPHVPSGAVTRPYTTKDTTQWEHIYPGAHEEIDPRFPKPLGNGLTSGIYFDSNHAHDERNRRSVTGILAYVAGTPITWMSKRQSAIATSTYTAEMAAMKTAAEEAINIRYMLRALGVPVLGRTALWGDNMGSLISTDNPGAQCTKKHSQVAFHYVRECNAAEIIDVLKVETLWNLSDPFTKALAAPRFLCLFSKIYRTMVPSLGWNQKGEKDYRRDT